MKISPLYFGFNQPLNNQKGMGFSTNTYSKPILEHNKIEQDTFNNKPANISFKNRYGVVELFKAGKFGDKVKYGIYGTKIDKKSCNREHVLPKSMGGTANNTNIVIADKYINSKRGTRPMSEFTTFENVVAYLQQFINLFVFDDKGKKVFDGNKYYKGLIPSLKGQGFPFR